jgi:hypothetical protein
VGVGIVLLLCTAFGMTGCNAAGYAYYLRVDDLKPLFVTIVDQSGSMSSFQAGIRALIEDSREQFLTEVYGDDEAAMDELYFIVPWGSGESWPEAFTSEPSGLMPDTAAQLIFANERVASMSEEEYSSFVETLDAYPVRVYLFYGNGGAPTYDTPMLQDYISGTSTEVFFTRCALVGVPGSSTPFIDGATAIIEEGVVEDPGDSGDANDSDSLDSNDSNDSTNTGASAGPVPMADYGWSFRRYDPNSTTTEEFVEGIIEAIRPTPAPVAY